MQTAKKERPDSSPSGQSLLVPPPLRPGDLIGVIAPSSPQRDDERLRAGMRRLERLGFRVRPGKHLWNRYGYLAGSDAERIEDFNAMARDPEVRMIVAGRGGYGATRILEELDYDALRRDPKIVLGFSDVTAVNLALLAKIGLVSLSGAMPGVDMWTEEPEPFAEESFLRATAGNWSGMLPNPPEDPPPTGLFPGKAEGRLLPANLTLLAALCGTPYMPDPDGAILLIEEIGEEAYRVDRLLSQLWNAGILKRISGLALGAFTGTDPTRISIDPLPIGEVFAEYVRRAAVPAVQGIPYGHIARKLTLPVGAPARIDGEAGTIELL